MSSLSDSGFEKASRILHRKMTIISMTISLNHSLHSPLKLFPSTGNLTVWMIVSLFFFFFSNSEADDWIACPNSSKIVAQFHC